MDPVTSWDKSIDGKLYNLSYERIDNQHVVTVNGTPIEIKEHFMSLLLGVDEKFSFDGNEARLLVRVKSSKSFKSRFDYIPDIVVDGFLLGSRKKYIKRVHLLWIFVIAAICSSLSLWGGEWFLAAYIVIGAVATRYRPSSLSIAMFAAVLAVAVFVCALLLLLIGGY